MLSLFLLRICPTLLFRLSSSSFSTAGRRSLVPPHTPACFYICAFPLEGRSSASAFQSPCSHPGPLKPSSHSISRNQKGFLSPRLSVPAVLEHIHIYATVSWSFRLFLGCNSSPAASMGKSFSKPHLLSKAISPNLTHLLNYSFSYKVLCRTI